MKLRSQLAIAGAFIVLLPLATGRYIGEMHEVLRDAGQRELQTWAAAIEAVIGNTVELQPSIPSKADIYAQYAEYAMTLDGYMDDWAVLEQPPLIYQVAHNTSGGRLSNKDRPAIVSLRSAVTDTALYLMFDVQDKNMVFYKPGLGSQQNGDRLLIYAGRGDKQKRFLVRAIAPGSSSAFQMFGHGENELLLPESAVKAFWQVKEGGYSIELKMPKPERLAYFGFSLIDSNKKSDTGLDAWIGTVDPKKPDMTGRIKYPSKDIESIMQKLVPQSTRIRLFDTQGWLLADVDRLSELPESSKLLDPNKSSLFDALLYRFFSWIMSDEQLVQKPPYRLDGPAHLIEPGSIQESWSGRYKNANMALMGEMRLLKGKSFTGYLLMERADESIAVVVNSTLARLFGILLLLFFSLLIGLYFYASWISTRISRLNHATADALQRDGHIKTEMPGIKARDEIGELSISISDMLSRLSSYTDYLRLLASRLAHELRTPLAVVSTSLESVDKSRLIREDLVFLKRAEDASKRLHGLIRSMSEATRLEQAIETTEFETLDLDDWLAAITPLYQSLYPDVKVRFRCQKGLGVAIVHASPELLQQMLDKVIANAADFSNNGAMIEVRLHSEGRYYVLDVVNEGSELASEIKSRLFDAMVSHRDEGQKEPHLGLGLYIVRLIVEKHGGKVQAENLAQKRVRIRIYLPARV